MSYHLLQGTGSKEFSFGHEHFGQAMANIPQALLAGERRQRHPHGQAFLERA
jgi:hypothetical protein